MSDGTTSGLRWIVDSVERHDVSRYRHFYPWFVTGRIVDAGIDCGHFTWFVPDLDRAAYVPAPGVEIPPDARVPNRLHARIGAPR